MRTLKLMTGVMLCLAATRIAAQEPVWNAAAIKECDRACLVGIMDGYMNALFAHDRKAVPSLAKATSVPIIPVIPNTGVHVTPESAEQ